MVAWGAEKGDTLTWDSLIGHNSVPDEPFPTLRTPIDAESATLSHCGQVLPLVMSFDALNTKKLRKRDF